MLGEREVRARVISMRSTYLFDARPAAPREQPLPNAVRAYVAVEAGAAPGLARYVGLDGTVVGLDRFGASAP